MSKLGTVVKFEITRTLKKPSFWIAAILMPVFLVGIIFISGMMGYNSESALENGSDTSELRLAILDESGLLSDGQIETAGLTQVADKDSGVKSIKDEQSDVFYFIPKDLATEPIEVYHQTENTTLFTNYDGTIRTLLAQAAAEKVDANEAAVLSGSYRVSAVGFKDGEEDNMLGRMIVPIAALGIFYILICVFGNRLTTSTIEEKETRITEMILTAVPAKTLIMGKIISLIALGFLQILILVVPMLIMYFYAGTVGGINIGELLPIIEWNPLTIIINLLLLIGGYVLFVGLCVLIGTLVPTAKDAAQYSSVVMMLVILPVFFMGSFMLEDPDLMVYVLSYFPFSAPIALMMRSAFGLLPLHEAIIGIVVICVFAGIIIRMAVKMFQFGALEFSKKIKLTQIISK